MKQINRILNYFILFFYIYTVGFVFFPGGLKTRMVIGAIGLFYFFFHPNILEKKIMKIVAAFSLTILIWSLVSMHLSSTFDSYWPRQSILWGLYLFGAAMCVSICKLYDMGRIFEAIVICILINNIVSSLCLLIPSFGIFIDTIQSDRTGFGMHRAFGLGNSFFGGGIITSAGLIMWSVLYKIKRIGLLKFLSVFAVLLLSGLIIARTSLLGLIGLLVFVDISRFSFTTVSRIALLFLFFSILVLYGKQIVAALFGEEVAFWAFELSDSYSLTGKMESSSMDKMWAMYDIVPDNSYTWVLGDGLMNNSDNSYYKNTDIGYLRLIWSMGLVGLFLYIFMYYKFLRLLYMYNKENFTVCLLLALLILSGMIKGVVEIQQLLFLILCSAGILYKKKNCLPILDHSFY